MRLSFLGLALACSMGLASAATVDELTSVESWMPATGTMPACELPATITFHKDGSVSGEPGCNRLLGQYRVGPDDELRLENMGLTRRMCAKSYMDQEASFVALINQTRFAKKEGKYLILMNEKREPIGKLEPEKPGSCA